MSSLLAFLTCLGSGIMGGVFFAFSTFVMQALAQLPARQGITAMQRINAVVLRPAFLGVFLGTAVLSGFGLAAAFPPWRPPGFPFLALAGFLYLTGTFLVTVVCNVPRNERLARLDPDSTEAALYWPVYVREWSRWNHCRTAASLGAAACSAGALWH